MKTYKEYLQLNGEYGIATEVRYPIVVVTGLPGAKIEEIVMFEEGLLGQVFSIEKDYLEILLFTTEKIKPGSNVARTGVFVSVEISKDLLGQTVGPLLLSEKEDVRYIDSEAPDISSRVKIDQPFLTGTTVVDLMIPLGKGQRELIIGDRKTGKTSFLLSAIINQARNGVIIIYAAIGRKQNEIKKLETFLEAAGVRKNILIVATSPDDAPGLIYLTPYSAMTMAEYFRDQGQDVAIILDDLTTHAKIYREISLVANRFPGRESYPGDIFYMHSKLLERAGSFKHEKGPVFITCLPVAETVEGDMRGYIPTNLMSMTDGHIFFDSNSYFQGLRPAINVPLSVTRVGRQTQSNLKKNITSELLSFLSRYNKVLTYAHFGSELSIEVELIIQRGNALLGLFNQHYKVIIPESIQLILIAMIWSEAYELKKDEVIKQVRDNLIASYDENRGFVDDLVNTDTLNNLIYTINHAKIELLKLCKVDQI